ncbi:Zinc finger CCCH domain-containing protein 4 [Auxenochlorella protothecoides]|uniref:Zinc finger CCCH domain-containing protein 4 n=1 Tax=Auxenochlorella protothecoides TaxID=3075 RepID=A0A087SLM4_AUXPR|nr:Zinc finger CCCH domain-containing protein 4 [Auxenochlorella protothecoides]KFM26628.1 Zinc finger CCCH domain-containing protein 4 [Auxenochlorella protothecoides]
MAHRLLQDPEADGWERKDFPIICETCLGPNPYVRMQRMDYGSTCHISGRPYTVFRWRPGNDARYKKTIICQEVAKAKNVCQCCLLDLDYNLPVQVRDEALGMQADQLPASDAGKEYALQRMSDAGELDHSKFDTPTAPELLVKLQRTTPYYKRNQAKICSFFVKGMCKRGAECPYRHEMPIEGPLSKQNIKDRYYGVNDPVAEKMLGRAAEMQKLTPPEDTSIATLFVGGLGSEHSEADLRDIFYTHGELKSVKKLESKGVAFVTFTTRQGAEAAAEALSNRLIIKGQSLALALLLHAAAAQTQMPPSGILYPPDSTGPAVVTVSQLERGMCPPALGSTAHPPVLELSIAGARIAMLAGRFTCTQLVQTYLDRIRVYDAPLGLNSVRAVDVEQALAAAATADAQLAAAIAQGNDSSLAPLFCTPMLLKDNFDVVGLATTAGSVALAENYPRTDAWVVRRLKAAGAIVFGKANMGEFALFPSFTLGSLAGFTRNPYHLHHSPAGSSGGSAAAVSANLALAALGTDTGNSVRGPASHAGVVGLRPSIGLVGRSGVVPLRLDRDAVGPLTRTVADAAALLGAMAGLDPGDEASVHELGGPAPAHAPPADYTRFLRGASLAGSRIGVLRSILDLPGTDVQIRAMFNGALYTMQAAGAMLVDNFTIANNSLGEPWSANRDGQGPALGHWNVDGEWSDLWACNSPFRSGMDGYLASRNASNVVRSLSALYAGGDYHPLSRDSILASLQAPEPDPAAFPTTAQRLAGQRCGCSYWWDDPCRTEFRKRLIESMDDADVDVLAYPTWNSPPLKIGDSFTGYYDGNNSPMISPQTGSPSISVPMGLNTLGLPAGITFLARPFDEGTLLAMAHAYEQASQLRAPPMLFPDCTGGSVLSQTAG